MKKIILLLLTCLALAISSCGKSGGDDDGKGGGGDNPDGTKTDLKKVLKFNADSEALKVQSVDFNSQQAIPIALDLPIIKEPTAKYTVTIKAIALSGPKISGTDVTSKISYGFGAAGGPHSIILEKGGTDSTKLFYQVSNSIGKYLVLQIQFYISYKNGSVVLQDNVNPVALIADRSIDFNEFTHIFLHSEMGKQKSFTVTYSSSIPSDVLKELSYVDKATYTVGLSADSSATTLLTQKLEFKVPGAIESEVQFIPYEDRSKAYADINVIRDNAGLQTSSYTFYRCGNDQYDEELYFTTPGGNSRVKEVTAPIAPNKPKTLDDIKSYLGRLGIISNIISCNSKKDSKLDMIFGAVDSDSAIFVVPNDQRVVNGDKKWSTLNSPAIDYGADLGMALIDKSPEATPDEVPAYLKLLGGGNRSYPLNIKITNLAKTAVLKWDFKDDKDRNIALLQGATKDLKIKVGFMPDGAQDSGRKMQLKINDIWKDDKCVLLFEANDTASVKVEPKGHRTNCIKDGGITLSINDNVEKSPEGIVIKATAKAISGEQQDVIISTPKCEDANTCQVTTFNDEGKPVKISVDNAKACYYPMFTYDSSGMIDKSCYKNTRLPTVKPSLIMPGFKKHFIVEVSSVNDTSIETATMTTFYLHAISIKNVSGGTLDEQEINKDSSNLKMYKLTLKDVDNKKAQGADRTITGLTPCAISNGLATDSVPQCHTDPSGTGGENRQFFLIEDTRKSRDDGNGYSTVGIRVFPGGDESSYIKTTKNLWAYTEATANDIRPNIVFKGFIGADLDNGGYGWRACELRALRSGDSQSDFDYNIQYGAGSAIYRICPTMYRADGDNITPIAINMTNKDYNKDGKAVCPQNSPTVLYGEELSVMYTDFSDLQLDFTGFDHDWSGGSIGEERTITIKNYSGQIKDIGFESTESSAQFTINLPVGDPNLSRCRDTDVYGVKTAGAPGRSANLKLNIKDFDLKTGQTKSSYPDGASVVITTDMCKNIDAFKKDISGGQGRGQCSAPNVGKVGSNFGLGYCDRNASDPKNPYEICNVYNLI